MYKEGWSRRATADLSHNVHKEIYFSLKFQLPLEIKLEKEEKHLANPIFIQLHIILFFQKYNQVEEVEKKQTRLSVCWLIKSKRRKLRNNLQPLKPYLQEKYLKISSIYIKKSRVCVEVSRWYFHYLFRFFFSSLVRKRRRGGTVWIFTSDSRHISSLLCDENRQKLSLPILYFLF